MKKIIINLLVIANVLLTGCSARQQASSVTETSVKEADKNQDTTKPTITFKADSVTVEVGADYKVEDNIKSVNDDTDGALKKVDKDKTKDGEAYYIIDDSEIDLKTAGKYTVKVTAQDSSGNVATNSFKLTVKEKAKETSKDSNKTETTKNETKSSEKNTTTSGSNKSTTSTKKSTSSTANSQSNSAASGNTQSNTANQYQITQQEIGGVEGCDHNWVYVDAQYKTETRVISGEDSHDEDVTVEKVQCIGCGALFDNTDEFYAHSDSTGGKHGNYTTTDVPTGETRHVIDSPAQTETVQTLVSPAHWECTKCGEWKA